MKLFGINISRSANKSEQRSESGGVFELQDFFGLPGADLVTPEGSLSLAAVYACVRILSQTVSTLPIHLYKRGEVKKRERILSHPSHTLVMAPNSYLNRLDLMQFLMTSVTLWGNGYARIFRDKNYRPSKLQLLMPYEVSPIYDKNSDELYYRVNGGEILTCDDIIHIKGLSLNGIEGKSPISIHRENLQLAFSAQTYGKQFFTQGANTSGYFSHPGALKTDKFELLKGDLIKQYSGLSNSHKPMLLEGGMKYERIGIPPEDAQFIATRKFQKNEIATIYGIPPHMIGDLERSTNNNIEHQGMEFVRYCLMPYITEIESEFNRKLLRNDEYSTFYFKFNLNALLRGDAKTRSEYYKNLNFIGAMNANEVRAYEDMDAYKGGDQYFVQLNMQTVSNATNPQKNE